MISFKGEWLGPKRFKLYKDGKFDFDKFFDPEGRFYSLDDLRKLDEKAFKSWVCNFSYVIFFKTSEFIQYENNSFCMSNPNFHHLFS